MDLATCGAAGATAGGGGGGGGSWTMGADDEPPPPPHADNKLIRVDAAIAAAVRKDDFMTYSSRDWGSDPPSERIRERFNRAPTVARACGAAAVDKRSLRNRAGRRWRNPRRKVSAVSQRHSIRSPAGLQKSPKPCTRQ